VRNEWTGFQIQVKEIALFSRDEVMIRRTLRMRIGFGAVIIPRLANDGL
jgi:hypothetical protein